MQIHSSVFRVDQSILTGESLAVYKTLDIVADLQALSQDKHNCVFTVASRLPH